MLEFDIYVTAAWVMPITVVFVIVVVKAIIKMVT
jgi:hypothetical protein